MKRKVIDDAARIVLAVYLRDAVDADATVLRGALTRSYRYHDGGPDAELDLTDAQWRNVRELVTTALRELAENMIAAGDLEPDQEPEAVDNE